MAARNSNRRLILLVLTFVALTHVAPFPVLPEMEGNFLGIGFLARNRNHHDNYLDYKEDNMKITSIDNGMNKKINLSVNQISNNKTTIYQPKWSFGQIGSGFYQDNKNRHKQDENQDNKIQFLSLPLTQYDDDDKFEKSYGDKIDGAIEAPTSASTLIGQIILSVLLILVIIATIVGNGFVIAAICLERNLRTVGNYLVFSLAVADVMVALLVMPFAAIYSVMGIWDLGSVLCDIWTAMDVLSCTSSILHLVAIALDRYWAVTRVDYIQSRSDKNIFILIAIVWSCAVTVSLAPILGWKDDDFEKRIAVDKKCMPSQDVSYQIFATLSTFYGPLVIILILYWRIFKVARTRIRNKPGSRVPTPAIKSTAKKVSITKISQKSSSHQEGKSTPDLSVPVNEVRPISPGEVTTSYPTSSTTTTTTTGTILTTSSNQLSFASTSSTLPKKKMVNFENQKVLEQSSNPTKNILLVVSAQVNHHISPSASILSQKEDEQDSQEKGKEEREKEEEKPDPKRDQVEGEKRKVNDHEQKEKEREEGEKEENEKMNNDEIIEVNEEEEEIIIPNCDPDEEVIDFPDNDQNKKLNDGDEELDDVDGDEDKQEEDVDNKEKEEEKKKNEKLFMFTIRKLKQMARRTPSPNMESADTEVKLVGGTTVAPKTKIMTRENLEAKRERKAAKTLAIITGTFVICWLPFFVVALVLPVCGDTCAQYVPDWLFSIFLWLGYFNSMINPIIYTTFNLEFRAAFKKLLCGKKSQQHRSMKRV